MFDIHVNLLAVLAATVASMIIGWLWYSPFLFGTLWTKGMGLTASQQSRLKAGTPRAMLVALVSAFVMSYIVAHFIVLLNITDASGALQFALWSWLGFIVTTQVTAVFFEGRRTSLFTITTSYYLVLLVIMSLLFAYWT